MVRTDHASPVRDRRLSGRAAALWLAAGCAVTTVPAGADAAAAARVERPRIDGLTARQEGGRWLVSFRLTGAPSDEDLERVRSGVPLTYRHRIEVRERRSVPLWPSKLLARATVEMTAGYDSLNRRYTLSREVRRKGSPGEPVPADERETPSVETLRSWLAEIEEMSVLEGREGLDPARVRVTVQSTIGRHYVMLLFPARDTVTAEWRAAAPAGGR